MGEGHLAGKKPPRCGWLVGEKSSEKYECHFGRNSFGAGDWYLENHGPVLSKGIVATPLEKSKDIRCRHAQLQARLARADCSVVADDTATQIHVLVRGPRFQKKQNDEDPSPHSGGAHGHGNQKMLTSPPFFVDNDYLKMILPKKQS